MKTVMAYILAFAVCLRQTAGAVNISDTVEILSQKIIQNSERRINI